MAPKRGEHIALPPHRRVSASPRQRPASVLSRSLLAALSAASLFVLAGCASHCPRADYGNQAIFEQQEVYISGTGGYHTYRIPSLIVTARGTVLAFCEGRRNSASDTGDIDILLRRSTDLGASWGPTHVVADHGPDTIGNPCPVVDRRTGTIWLLLTGNLGTDNERQIKERTSEGSRTVWVCHSRDDGLTWSEPEEITAAVKNSVWTWYATGPGCGIQLRSGRMVIPCDHVAGPDKILRSHIIYSDDGGRSWQIGGVVGDGTNECQIVELADGSLMLNMRSYATDDQAKRRAVALSRDGGLTFEPLYHDPALIEPVCQASFVRFTRDCCHARDRLLFANPASTKREKMTVKLSYDEGKTWAVARELYAGPSAYSALAVLPDLSAACLYERGQKRPYEQITYARFSLEWLTDHEDTLGATE